MFEGMQSMEDVLASLGYVGQWEADYTADRMRTLGQLTTLHSLTPNQGADGVSWSQIDRALHPDDIDLVQGFRRFPSALVSGPLVTQFRLIDADGQIRWLEARGEILIDRYGYLTRTKGIVFETGKDAFASLPAEASLAGLDRLSGNLLQACREARELGLPDVEAELKPTLAKVVRTLSRKFRQAAWH